MKLGFGLYRHMLNQQHYDFARQCGATAVIVHLVDYFKTDETVAKDQPVGGLNGWGFAGDAEKIWSVEELVALKKEINDAGLELYGIENFDPAHWHDILLDGPKRAAQIDKVKQTLRNIGAAGIPVMGYNFSLAGVAGRKHGPIGRGNATVCYMDGIDASNQTPIKKGMVWNMIYAGKLDEEVLPFISHDELWRRLQNFLQKSPRSPKRPVSNSPVTPMTRPSNACANSPAWSTSRTCSSVSSPPSPAPATASNSASAPSPK